MTEVQEPGVVAIARARIANGKGEQPDRELVAWADHFTYLADWEPKYGFDRPPMHPVVGDRTFRAYGHTIGPAQRQLQSWVGGCSLTAGLEHDRGDGTPGLLRIEGKLGEIISDTMRWSVQFRQYGHVERSGLCTGSSAEDVCNRAVELILEEEAERLLLVVVPGLS